MTTIKATDARIPPEIFSAVASGGGPVKVTRHKQAVYLVNESYIRIIEALEDRFDIDEAEKAIAEIESGEAITISWEELKAQAGL